MGPHQLKYLVQKNVFDGSHQLKYLVQKNVSDVSPPIKTFSTEKCLRGVPTNQIIWSKKMYIRGVSVYGQFMKERKTKTVITLN